VMKKGSEYDTRQIRKNRIIFIVEMMLTWVTNFPTARSIGVRIRAYDLRWRQSWVCGERFCGAHFDSRGEITSKIRQAWAFVQWTAQCRGGNFVEI
jgi:hypothetical protein